MRLPGPVRAAVGLLATAADEARNLPERAIELPMLAVSTALQASLRAQQRYARLTARGDEALSRRDTGDDPPTWATFDEPVVARRGSGNEQTRNATELLDELFGSVKGPEQRDEHDDAVRYEIAAEQTAAAKKKAAKKAAKRGTTKKATVLADTKTADTKTAGTKKSGGTRSGKSVSSPRHTAPSRFDTVGDQPDDSESNDADTEELGSADPGSSDSGGSGATAADRD